jgi:hypothetical protein
MNKELKQYYKACENLKDEFLKSISEGKYIFDSYWIGEEIGGVLHFGDYFVNLNTIVEYFENKCTLKEFFGWYEMTLKYNDVGKNPLSLRTFKRLILNKLTQKKQ